MFSHCAVFVLGFRPLLVERRQVVGAGVQGAAAAVFGACTGGFAAAHAEEGQEAKQGMNYGSRVQGLGSEGLSAWTGLKLDEASANLAEPATQADAKIKPALDVYAKTLLLVRKSDVDSYDESGMSAAAGKLAGLAEGTPALEALAASISKRGLALGAECANNNVGAAAMVMLTLADEVIDFAWGYAAAERPLAPLREGAPPLKPP